MKKYLIASLILAATTVPSLAAAQHFVVEDTEKYCSVIDAAPSKDLKILGQKQGYGWTQAWLTDADGGNRRLLLGEDGKHIYGTEISPDSKYVDS